jgi:hypothetical protein
MISTGEPVFDSKVADEDVRYCVTQWMAGACGCGAPAADAGFL